MFATINLYQINHKALLIANEVNRFICRVIRAHLRDLRTKKKKRFFLRLRNLNLMLQSNKEGSGNSANTIARKGRICPPKLNLS